jgi:hypothetical protein
MRQHAIEGRIVYSKKSGMPNYKRYLDEMPGVALQNDWDDIMPASGNESLGYPTQKPLALMERIIQASSNEGDTVLDPFCGCGTTIHGSQKLNRQAVKSGYYETPFGKFPKLQILTIRELFDGSQPKLPWIDPNAFKRIAREALDIQTQLGL